MKADLLRPFEQIPYFTIEGFRQSTGMDSPEQTRMLLHRWVKAGRILPLKKGMYMTNRFYELHVRDTLFTEAISAIIFPQSYLSLEFVLQKHNILTEVTYPVTCITPKNTRRIVNQIGTFWYRNIRPDLYYGFAAGEYNGIPFFTASLAKALFDFKPNEKLRQTMIAYDRLLLVDDPRRVETKKPLGPKARKKKQKSKR